VGGNRGGRQKTGCSLNAHRRQLGVRSGVGGDVALAFWSAATQRERSRRFRWASSNRKARRAHPARPPAKAVLKHSSAALQTLGAVERGRRFEAPRPVPATGLPLCLHPDRTARRDRPHRCVGFPPVARAAPAPIGSPFCRAAANSSSWGVTFSPVCFCTAVK